MEAPLPPLHSPAELAGYVERTIYRYVRALVTRKSVQAAVLERPRLAEKWDLRAVDFPDGAPEVLPLLFRELRETERAKGLRKPPYWLPDVAPRDIARLLERTKDPAAKPLAIAMREGTIYPKDDGHIGHSPDLYVREIEPLTVDDDDNYAPDLSEDARVKKEIPLGRTVSAEMARALARWNISACALIVSIENEVMENLEWPSIALDAGQAHHEILTGMVQLSASKSRRLGTKYKTSTPERPYGWCEIQLPGQKSVQLKLPLDGESFSEAFTNAIKQWRSYLGLRHWAALQRLLSIEGGRTGRVRWRLEDHLNALGFSQRWRENPANRAAVAQEVVLLTKMELAVYWPDGTLRLRAPVMHPAASLDAKMPDGSWSLEGMELQINETLYAGVRDKNGEIGKHWFPAPAELAKIDHVRFPHAIALGLVLPLRWRWMWAEQQKDHLTLEAAKLLNLAGIAWNKYRPSRAWEALDRNLDELVRIGELGRVEWMGDKHALKTMVRLYPADWLLDRTLRGLAPVEKKRVDAPATGAQLAAWRKAKGLSQIAVAEKLGINEKTIRRAEAATEKPLGRSILRAFNSLSLDRPARTGLPPLDPDT
jgi:DNA-binding XRE family transcriptional regulator